MHTYAYLRVSTAGQTTDNQAIEIEAAGYEITATYADTISGKTPALDRPEFRAMLDSITRTRPPKRLIVTKLDRLGRDASDVLATVRCLESAGCAVKVLQLSDLDLTSAAGKLILTTLSAVAEMERDLLVERTLAGQARARRDGKVIGRPAALTAEQVQQVRQRLDTGDSVSAVAREFRTSRATIIRARDAAPATTP